MDEHVVITGAASGLGLVLARTVIGSGRRVAVVDRDAEAVQAAAAELSERSGLPVPVVVADLATLPGVDAAAEQLLGRVGVGALINNAGGWLAGDQFPVDDPDRWLSAVTLNLLAPMRLTARLWSSLRGAAAGAVVNIGSSAGEGDRPYGSPEYATAKAGLRRFTASLGSRPEVRVMSVVPAWIGLERAQRERAEFTPAEQQAAGPLVPPQDVTDAVLGLLEHGRPGQIVAMPGDPDPP